MSFPESVTRSRRVSRPGITPEKIKLMRELWETTPDSPPAIAEVVGCSPESVRKYCKGLERPFVPETRLTDWDRTKLLIAWARA